MSRKSKLFWLKMPKDFFKRHDMRIIEGMDFGKDMLLFYIKLLCESLDHDGRLRYSDKIPYTASMLATITNTDEGVVHKAMDVLVKLGLVEVTDDETIVMTKVPDMTGSETYQAQYMRDYRGKREGASLGEFGNVVLTADELKKLKDFYPSYWMTYIEKLSAHKASGGKSYESDYATIKKWLLEDVGDMENEDSY